MHNSKPTKWSLFTWTSKFANVVNEALEMKELGANRPKCDYRSGVRVIRLPRGRFPAIVQTCTMQYSDDPTSSLSQPSFQIVDNDQSLNLQQVFTPRPSIRLVDFEEFGIDINDAKTYFYHLGNQSTDTSTWKTCMVIPNKVRNAIYPHETARPIYPVYLKKQFEGTCIAMEIFAKRMGPLPGYPVFLLRAPTVSMLEKLHGLIHQWLSRPDDDKVAMWKARRLTLNRNALLQSLREMFVTFVDEKVDPSSSDSLEKIEELKRKLQNAHPEEASGLFKSINKLKYMCVVATFKYLVIDTPLDALTNFCDFYRSIEALPSYVVSPDMMMTAVWYMFELFVPHLNYTVANAMAAWKTDEMCELIGRHIFRERYQTSYQHVAGRAEAVPVRSEGPMTCSELNLGRNLDRTHEEYSYAHNQENRMGMPGIPAQEKVGMYPESWGESLQRIHGQLPESSQQNSEMWSGFSQQHSPRSPERYPGSASQQNSEVYSGFLSRSPAGYPERIAERFFYSNCGEDFRMVVERNSELYMERRFERSPERYQERVSGWSQNYSNADRLMMSGSPGRMSEGFSQNSFNEDRQTSRSPERYYSHLDRNSRSPDETHEMYFERSLDRSLEGYPQNYDEEAAMRFSERSPERHLETSFERDLQRSSFYDSQEDLAMIPSSSSLNGGNEERLDDDSAPEETNRQLQTRFNTSPQHNDRLTNGAEHLDLDLPEDAPIIDDSRAFTPDEIEHWVKIADIIISNRKLTITRNAKTKKRLLKRRNELRRALQMNLRSSSKEQLIELWRRLRQEVTSRRSYLQSCEQKPSVEEQMEEDAKLGLPADAPKIDDRREFTPEELKTWVNIAQEVIENNVVVGRERVKSNEALEKALSENLNESATKRSLIYLWSSIRQQARCLRLTALWNEICELKAEVERGRRANEDLRIRIQRLTPGFNEG